MTKASGYFQYYNGTERLGKVLGLDISSAGAQYPMDFEKAYQSGARFVWFKCSQRADFKDANFTSANIQSARDAGLKVGAYHFNQPSITGYLTTDAETEADWFLTKMQEEFGAGQFGDIMPMFDFEDNSALFTTNDGAYDYIEAFINRVKSVADRQCILYTAVYYVDGFINPTTGTPAQIAQKLVHSTKGGIYQVAPLMLASRAPDVYTGVNRPAEPPYPNYNYYEFGGYPTELWTSWQFSSDNPDVHMGATYGASSLDIDEDLLESPIYSIMPPQKIEELHSVAGNAEVLLTWNASTEPDVTGYNIYQDDVKINTALVTGNSYLVTGLTNDTEYKFEVTAEDEWEESEKSLPAYSTPAIPVVRGALAGKKAKIVAYGSSISFSGEATTATGDQIYQITDTTKRIWCKECNITVLDSATPTTENYILDRLTGRVIFETSAVRDITLDGEYLPVADIGCAYEYTYTLEADNVDFACFEDEYTSREQTLKDFSASISKFWNPDQYFLNKLDSDEDFIVEFYSDGSVDPDLRAWAKVATNEISGAVDGLVEESIDLEGCVDIDKRAISFGPF
jgi:chitodextrinase